VLPHLGNVRDVANRIEDLGQDRNLSLGKAFQDRFRDSIGPIAFLFLRPIDVIENFDRVG
jgi:hypothetical protein